VATKTSAPVGSARRTDRAALAHQLASPWGPAAPEDDPAPFGDEPVPCPSCGKETVLTKYVSSRHDVDSDLCCDRCRRRFDQGAPAPLGAAA
jgi:hypothetical protein